MYVIIKKRKGLKIFNPYASLLVEWRLCLENLFMPSLLPLRLLLGVALSRHGHAEDVVMRITFRAGAVAGYRFAALGGRHAYVCPQERILHLKDMGV
ncbi:MAG: hypothetical protein NZ529_01000 [Cytophagaceae bacterium]|nr:hypothetical protein [Cytophagaceae bacterium]MDW8455343.1 hypothetical protein [Cytophagaceae bacterium]